MPWNSLISLSQVSRQFFRTCATAITPFRIALEQLGLSYVPTISSDEKTLGVQMQHICRFRRNWLMLHPLNEQKSLCLSPRPPLHVALSLGHIIEVHHPKVTGNDVLSTSLKNLRDSDTNLYFYHDFMHSFTIDPVQDLSVIVLDSWTRNP